MSKQYTVEQAHRLQDLAESLLDKRLTLKSVKEIAAQEFPELGIHKGRCNKETAFHALDSNATATYEQIEKEAVTPVAVDSVTNTVTTDIVDTVTKTETPEIVDSVTPTNKQALQKKLSLPVVQYVVYHRVSTEKQGRSGLGLEAQQRDIDVYLTSYSDQPYKVLGTFTDVRSAKGHRLADRPVLAEAVELAERAGAVLLVSKLDRLCRSVELVSSLLNNKNLSVRVACMPNADKMQLQIYAVLAEQERDFISARTKAVSIHSL